MDHFFSQGACVLGTNRFICRVPFHIPKCVHILYRCVSPSRVSVIYSYTNHMKAIKVNVHAQTRIRNVCDRLLCLRHYLLLSLNLLPSTGTTGLWHSKKRMHY